MGHWENSRDHKAAIARRNAASALASARGYVIGLTHGGAMREPDGIDEVLTRVHERRGIRELLVVGERDGWPEMDRWRRWWCVDVDYILAASLCVSRPRAIITPNPHPELLARAKWFGVVVWDPFVVPGSGSLAYAPAGAREPATRRVGPV